ncbi:MAG: DUF4167 domain-containing protein [Pseudomonadota bacterium]
MKRGRNQRRRQGMNVNRALDSNGPDVRIRGTANQIYDKYQTLARDASSAGDRVKAENYLQHAEHYFRLIKSMQPQNTQNQNANPPNGNTPNTTMSGDTQSNGGSGGEDADQPDVDDRANTNASDNNEAGQDDTSPRSDTRQRDTKRRRRPAAESGSDKASASTEAATPDQADTEQPDLKEAASDAEEPKKPVRRTRRKRVTASESADA